MSHANIVSMSVSGTPGTGTVTLGSAIAGFQSFSAAYGATTTIPGVLFQDFSGSTLTGQEVCENCVYDHGAGTITRGTRVSSSESWGGALTLSSAAVVSVVATADAGRRWDSAALQSVAASVTTADVTGVVGQMSELDISGLTAARSFVLPTGAPVNSMCGFRITVGYTGTNYSYGLKYTAGTAETLNGVAAGTEVSRCIITNEQMVFKCTASGVWKVERDGRKPQACCLSLTTDADGETPGGAWYDPTSYGGAWTQVFDIGTVRDLTNGFIYSRRAGNFTHAHGGRPKDVVNAGGYFSTGLWLNGNTTAISALSVVLGGAAADQPEGARTSTLTMAAGDYIKFRYTASDAAVGADGVAFPRVITYFQIIEVLT